jgi:hypothetical protein
MIDSGKPRLRMELTIKSVIDGKKVYNTAKGKVNMQTHKNKIKLFSRELS